MKFLVIQTAFVGDVILATAVLEKLHRFYPDSKIDIVVRKGNETLFFRHPFINKVFVWNKKKNKLTNLFKLLADIRKEKYNHLINLQRFASSGILTVFSKAKNTIGFNKNPLSFFFTERKFHDISRHGKIHEVQRNLSLVESLTDLSFEKPRIYPGDADNEFTNKFKESAYITMAPASVWYTKQLPKEKWIELIQKVYTENENAVVYLLGGLDDKFLCDEIIEDIKYKGITNLSGRLTLLQSASLMKDAKMNYVNDSAPLHLASAMNAPVTAYFCSTVPAFGFTPLSDISYINETKENLYCRPCGLHGYRDCPETHFRCAKTIEMEVNL